MSTFRAVIVGGLVTGTLGAAVGVTLGFRAARPLGSVAIPSDEVGPAEIPDVAGLRVHSADELDKVLRNRKTRGRVIIPKDVDWKMERCDQLDESGKPVCTPLLEIPLYDGVQLVGERGELGSRPLLSTKVDATESRALFEVCGNDVLLQGLHLQGPQPGDQHETQSKYVHGVRVWENAEEGALSMCAADLDITPKRKGVIGHRVVIADNEFDQWTGGAVSVIGGHRNILLSEWVPNTCAGNPACCVEKVPVGVEQQVADGVTCWQPLTPADAGLVRVERNFIHHNARDAGGYGIDVNGGAYVTAMGNVFNYNRHAVAATGRAHSGYVARFNYVLQGGYLEGGSWWTDGYYNQHFDVHGEGDKGYGGAGGTFFDISFNTIRGEQTYYVTQTRPAFMLRGTPAVGVDFFNNVLGHDSSAEAIHVKYKVDSAFDVALGIVNDTFVAIATTWFRESGNRYNTDHASDFAAGDFDGDGRTDVFLANGTGWFFSRAGKKPWEFLHASNKPLDDLSFADIDNDGVTDVLYRDGAGSVGVLRSGRYPLAPLTWIPVDIEDLRAGDFDGDGKTDLFYTHEGQWRVRYGSTGTWTHAQTSSQDISELLLGEFDDVPGTDVATVLASGWAYSRGATGSWAALNSKLTGSFTNAVAADFDGNGRTDIAFKQGSSWRVSADGRAGDAHLVSGPKDLNEWLVGRFVPGAPAMAVNFGLTPDGEWRRFVIWRGLGSGDTLHPWSEHDMR